jgi:hypothetical protein
LSAKRGFDWMKNGLKNIWKRIELWLFLALIGILGDEFVKEGYLFCWQDIIGGGFTHEKIIVFLWLPITIIVIWRKIRKRC